MIGEDPLVFPRVPYRVVWPDHLGIELVAQSGKHWLVAAFRQVKRRVPARLYFGILHWDRPGPTVEIIPDKDAMRRAHSEFGIGSSS